LKKIGDKCYINGVSSVDSLLLYKNLQNKYPSLMCPCHIPNTQLLEIIGFIGKTSVIIKYVDGTEVSVIKIKDLRFPKLD
jgi:hypothetical protein